MIMNELDNTFAEIAQIIEDARDNAYRKVNEELILMYKKVGQFLSEKSKDATYGDGYIDSLSEYIRQQFPRIKGFNRRGLYRMKQFYETYARNEKVSALLTQLSWTNHLIIMSGSKSDEEREFYIRLYLPRKILIHYYYHWEDGVGPMLWNFSICRTPSTRTTSAGHW